MLSSIRTQIFLEFNLANSGEKTQLGINEEAIAKTLMMYMDNQDQKNEIRLQAFLQEFCQTSI